MNGKAVAMTLTPGQQARLKKVMAEWRTAIRLDYMEERWGISREEARAHLGLEETHV